MVVHRSRQNGYSLSGAIVQSAEGDRAETKGPRFSRPLPHSACYLLRDSGRSKFNSIQVMVVVIVMIKWQYVGLRVIFSMHNGFF